MAGLTSDQALDLLVQLFPLGFSKLFGVINRVGDVYNLLAGISDATKQYVYDNIAQIRLEINPATALYKVPDYENALGLSQTSVALSGTTAQRRTQIISKLREQGAFTLDNIRAIIGPLLGYADPSQLVIVETSRSALTTAHTYANNAGASIGSNSSTAQSVTVLDDGGVSDAGVKLLVNITCTNPEQLSFTLTGPTGGVGSGQAVVTFPAGSMPAGSVTGVTYSLSEHSVSPGKKLLGNWSLQINTGAAACTLVSWSLFVEGGGQRDATGASGQGEEIHEWGIFLSPLLMNSPNMPAVLSSLQRIKPGDSIVDLLYSIAGSYPDTTSGVNSSIPDTCLPA